jgi:predicted nucleic acid-binding protein
MTIVVDASVAVRWFFNLDRSDRAEGVLQSGEHIVAPDLVLPEITNAVWRFVNFGHVSAHAATAILQDAAKPFDELALSVGLKDRALAIALELRHPAYDCFYLALAEQRNTQVVTADDRLLRRCTGTPFAQRVAAL